MEPHTKHVAALVRAVEHADRKLREAPDIVRKLADDRTQALRALIIELGSAAKAARALGWSPQTVYRVRDGHFARTPARSNRKEH